MASIGSATDCQNECQKDIKCTHFTYDTKSKKCYLKNGDGRVTTDSASTKYISGPRQCKFFKLLANFIKSLMYQHNIFIIYSGACGQFSGNFYSRYTSKVLKPVGNAEMCYALCRDHKDRLCKGWTFNLDVLECRLFLYNTKRYVTKVRRFGWSIRYETETVYDSYNLDAVGYKEGQNLPQLIAGPRTC